MKRKLRRKGTAPPGAAVTAQPEDSRLHGIEIGLKRTTAPAYVERTVSATGVPRHSL
jgi:hypothetical protein